MAEAMKPYGCNLLVRQRKNPSTATNLDGDKH
jgi:hypothetical protein